MTLIHTELWPPVMREGTRDPAVAVWQAELVARGFNLAGDTPGVFGHGTHNATLAYQRLHSIGRDGAVGKEVRATIALDTPIAPAHTPLEALPQYIEAKHWNRVVVRSVVDLIVLHCTESPEASIGAERCAKYFQIVERMASAHRVFDDDGEVLCVPTNRIAFHAPGANKNGIGYEHCGYARQNRDQWLDPFGTAMLTRSAKRGAVDAAQWGIPIVYCDAAALKAGGARGFTTHNEVTKAFGRSTHTDPGKEFPIDLYMQWVKEAA